MVYSERKVAAFIQQRYGPYLVGPRGMLQPIADVVKLIFKEPLQPLAADRVLFFLAPLISATAAFAAFAVVPFGGETTLFGLLEEPICLQVADVNVGRAGDLRHHVGQRLRHRARRLELEQQVLAVRRAALGVADDQLRAGLRMSLASVLLLAGSLSVTDIVNAQEGLWFGFIPKWFVFLQPVGFAVFIIAGVAETNRAPFDLPEAEQELVAGYHTEYSSTAFMMFFLAEYINMVTACAVATDVFLGGWHGPFLPEGSAGSGSS